MDIAYNHRQWCIEYLKDFDGLAASKRCGQSDVSASNHAYRMLMRDDVNAYLAEKMEERAEIADVNAIWVLREWKKIASADPAEIIWVERECCRFCYGVGHLYQWTQHEFAQAIEAAARHRCNQKCAEPCEKRMPPDGAGGFGYTPLKAPQESCPVCHGRGFERVMLADTKRLRGSARKLYAGVKTTQHGIEVKMRNQDEALKNIAQYLGMLINKSEIAGPHGGPIPMEQVTAKDLTDDELARMILAEEEKERARLAGTVIE